MTDASTVPLRILIVDNEEPHAEAVAEVLQRAGHQCVIVTSGTAATERIAHESFDLIITDLVMSDVDGLGVLAKAKEVLPDAEVILLTGHATIDSAVQATRQGALDYIEKPLDINRLRTAVEKAADNLRLRRTIADLNRRLDERFGFEGIVGTSPKMQQVIDLLRRVAPSDVRVLISGENGTGKELVAKAIHQNSHRKKKPFLALNCASFVENILDVELFGSVPGIYTDARDRAGKFEYANGGTLFLDEIGDMPLPTQSKLLRVLESNEITRVGANEPIKVNVRVLSATNKNLREEIAAGRFREDLFHRLRVVEITLPPLRERAQDIPLLLDHFLKQACKRHNKQVGGLSTTARRRLLAFSWPGNVRQLINFVEWMVVVDNDGLIDVDDLPPELADQPEAGANASSAPFASLVGRPLEEIEKMFIAETLKFTGGNREEAAHLLDIGQRTLYRKIDKFGL
jgi:two-component system response regulator HydG